MNVKTQKMNTSCDVKWLIRIYGKWKGDPDDKDVMVDESKNGMSNEDNDLDELSNKGFMTHEACSKINECDEEDSTDDFQNKVIIEAVDIPRNNIDSICLVGGEDINKTNPVTYNDSQNHKKLEKATKRRGKKPIRRSEK